MGAWNQLFTWKHPHMRGEDPKDLLTILAVEKAV